MTGMKTTAERRRDTPSACYSSRDKVTTVEALAGTLAAVRQAGRTVVLAHGVFDLVHLGHVRHLEEARRHGDVLVVTVTADCFVNKGPGRPAFPDHLRAQMVAALESVDWVAVSDNRSAVPILHALRPDVYVKGSDYADAARDVTGGIIEERRAVEAHGGRLVFTDDITFSASSLINRYVAAPPPALRSYLGARRGEDVLAELLRLFDAVADFRIVLVGDTILDEYVYVEPMSKPPKEPIIATLRRDGEIFAGGVTAAANHVASFCGDVEVVTALGDCDGIDAESLVRASLKPNVRLTSIRCAGKPTTRKTRFIDRRSMRKLFEVYVMDDGSVAGPDEAAFARLLADRTTDRDVVIVTDFGHGLITGPCIETLVRTARFLAINAQTNSANHGFNLITRYPRADYVCIDALEARLACADKDGDLQVIAGEKLPGRIECGRLIITQGSQGCITFDHRHGVCHVPALSNTAVDIIGAGDAFLAVTAPLVATGGRMDLIGFAGNAVGAMKVGIVGHRKSIDKVPLIKYLAAVLK